MCYMFKPSKTAEFSRIFDDSSLKTVTDVIAVDSEC